MQSNALFKSACQASENNQPESWPELGGSQQEAGVDRLGADCPGPAPLAWSSEDMLV